MSSLWQNLSIDTKIIDLVTLTFEFDLLLKNFNIGNNFWMVSDRAFIFHIYIYIPCDKTFPLIPKFLTLWLGPLRLTYFKKNFNQGYISLTIRAGALVFHMYIPHGQTYNFWPWLLTLTFDLLFEKHYPWLYLLHCKEQGFDISHADFFWWDLYFDTILLTLWPWLWILTYF